MLGLETCEREESHDDTGRTIRFMRRCAPDNDVVGELVCIFRESPGQSNASLTLSNPDGGFRYVLEHVASRIRSHCAAYPSFLGGDTRLNLCWSTTIDGVGPVRHPPGIALRLRVGTPAEIAEAERLAAAAAQIGVDPAPSLVCLGGGPREAMFVRSLFDEVMA